MKRSTLFSAIAAFCIAGALPPLAQHAMAQPAPPTMPDPYGDGTVTRADAEAMASKRFDALDTNHDGFLSPEEMAAGRPPRPAPPAGAPPRSSDARRQGFNPDTNGDGKIDRGEYAASQLRRFDRMDENKDGKLTKEERTNFFEDQRARMMLRMGGGGGT